MDFEIYKERYLTLPLERYIEGFRKAAILEGLREVGYSGCEKLLEVGIGVGGVSRDLPVAKKVIIVEPIQEFIERDRARPHPGELEYFGGTLSEFRSSQESACASFDCAILSSVLHEMPSASLALNELSDLIRPGGLVVIVVPNRRSFHRLIGLALNVGFEEDGRTLTEAKMGQRQAFSQEELSSLLLEAGFDPVLESTFLPKLLPSDQLNTLLKDGELDKDLIEALFRNSSAFEPYGSEMLTIARRRGAQP